MKRNLKSDTMDHLVGVALIVVSASSFGAMAIFARLAYDAGTDPITVLFLRFTIAAVFMVAIMTVKGIAFPRGRTLMSLSLMGALGYVGFSLAFFTALTNGPCGTGCHSSLSLPCVCHDIGNHFSEKTGYDI
jgi:drug/metabolite transporter (DMT)-like permease